MDVVKYYFRDRYKIYIMMIMYILMSSVVFWLYNIDTSAILYSMIISGFCGAVVVAADVMIYTKAYIKRSRIINQPQYDFNLEEAITEVSSVVDRQYLYAIDKLIKEHRKVNIEREEDIQEQRDYTMIWAHQIKTPITAMNLLLQATDSELNSDLANELFEIEGYVDMMLQYIRLDNVNNDFKFAKVCLDDIVKACVRYYSKVFISKKLLVSLDNLQIKVRTDDKWTVFVVKQILSNALKYTHSGSIKIYAIDSGNEKKLIIEDTGIGISPEDLPRVFDRAFTGFNGHMDRKATGIGLFMSKKIIDTMGHSINIESHVGVGTKVIIGFQDWDDSDMAD